MFTKTTFEDSKNFERSRTLIFAEKNADVSRIQGVCHMIYVFFGCSLGKV